MIKENLEKLNSFSHQINLDDFYVIDIYPGKIHLQGRIDVNQKFIETLVPNGWAVQTEGLPDKDWMAFQKGSFELSFSP